MRFSEKSKSIKRTLNKNSIACVLELLFYVNCFRWCFFQIFLEFSPRKFGEDEPILTSIFFRMG